MEDNTHMAKETFSVPRQNPIPFQLNGHQLLTTLEQIGTQDIPKAIRFLTNKLAANQEKEIVTQKKHTWDTYELSQKVQDMAPKERKDIYGEYQSLLTDILEQEYK